LPLWNAISSSTGNQYQWDGSAYIARPPFFDNFNMTPGSVADIHNAKPLAILGDSVTTDHISPAGSFKATTPAGKYLQSKGVPIKDFNSYGARRGNHEVMIRGTFANIRLRNLLAPGTEGGWTKHFPDGQVTTIYEASVSYQQEGIPLIVIAGKEYGSGSSRDWAAKGTLLLGVKAVIAESFERIHRSNLVGMGVLPLEFMEGENPKTLGLTGLESYSIEGITSGITPGGKYKVRAVSDDGGETVFIVAARVDTPEEATYYRHGGILPYVLRQLLQDTPVARGTS
ncbi:MAG TPA: aconitate hydratase, partial [bacterium]|nr:aconitate hydratase [bacterium]